MIIGISGKKQSGKNTVAKMLQYFLWCKHANVKPSYEDYLKYRDLRFYQVRVQIVSFADILKRIVSAMTNCNLDNFEDDSFKNSLIPDHINKIFPDKEKKHTYRELLQYLGTDIFRNLYKDIWVDSLLYRVNKTPNLNFIVSDVRFPNEAEAIVKKSPVNFIIKVIRNKEENDNHLSETSIDLVKAKYIIRNEGSIEQLFNTVKILIDEMNPIYEDFEYINREVTYGINPESLDD